MNSPIPVLDLTEPWPDPDKLCTADNPTAVRTHDAEHFAEHGYLISEGLLDDDTIDRYCSEFEKVFPERAEAWQYATPYRDHPFVQELVTDRRITEKADELIGEEMAVHLNLSNWRSTQRNWHQDGYLNPDGNLDWYVAVWIALDDIHPDAGPFEWIPGSHRMFDVIRKIRMLRALPLEQATGPNWPTHSEAILTPFFENQISELNLDVHQFLAKKGDVLFWHARTLHRGSPPNNPNLERRAMIAHYSGVTHRPDMPAPIQLPNLSWVFPVDDGHRRPMTAG